MEEQRKEEIERCAQSVLGRIPAWIWDGKRLPVPVDDIAGRFDLLIREIDDLKSVPGCPPLGPDEHLSGMLFPGRGEIWVDAGEASRWPGRRRFTVCHELGHWFMHRDPTEVSAVDEPMVFCRHSDVDDGETADAIEAEADLFASAMLMPAGLIRHHYSETGGDFDELCRVFGASRKAMGRRLHATIPRT